MNHNSYQTQLFQFESSNLICFLEYTGSTNFLCVMLFPFLTSPGKRVRRLALQHPSCMQTRLASFLYMCPSPFYKRIFCNSVGKVFTDIFDLRQENHIYFPGFVLLGSHFPYAYAQGPFLLWLSPITHCQISLGCSNWVFKYSFSGVSI